MIIFVYLFRSMLTPFLGGRSHWPAGGFLEATYDRIAEMLEDIRQSFDISREKVVATVTDNASNFAKPSGSSAFVLRLLTRVRVMLYLLSKIFSDFLRTDLRLSQ